MRNFFCGVKLSECHMINNWSLELKKLGQKIDSANFLINGIRDDLPVLETKQNIPKANEAFEIIKKIVADINRKKSNLMPIHIRYRSDPVKIAEIESTDNGKPTLTAVLLGEQHKGGNHLGIRFYHSNQVITETLLAMYASSDLFLGDALKEGCSKILFREEYAELGKHELIKLGLNPLQSVLQLLHRHSTCLQVYASESVALTTKFIIFGFLAGSLPGAIEGVAEEQQRLMEILINNSSADKEQLIELLIEDFLAKPQIKQYLEDEIISFYTVDSTRLVANCHSRAGGNLLRLLYYPYGRDFAKRVTLAKKLNELNEFLSQEIELIAKERDKIIVEQFKKFKTGIHPILIGERHLDNLFKCLEENDVAVISLSPFR